MTKVLTTNFVPATKLAKGDRVFSPDGDEAVVEDVRLLSRNQAVRAGLSSMNQWVLLTINGHTDYACDADPFEVAVLPATLVCDGEQCRERVVETEARRLGWERRSRGRGYPADYCPACASVVRAIEEQRGCTS